MPKISIIVPVYNVKLYLKRCIDSILSQTFKNFELILVDDVSSDDCPQICDEYAIKDARIAFLHKRNEGLSSVRNADLDVVKGGYIGFVDSDDWIAPDVDEYLYNLIKNNDADVVSGKYVLTHGDNAIFSKSYTEDLIIGTHQILKYYLGQDKLHGKNDFPVWIKFYKRSLFNKIRFPNKTIYKDNITNFLILSKSDKHIKTIKEIYAYFQRPQSIIKTKLTEKYLSLIDVSNKMVSLVQNYDKELQNLAEKIVISLIEVYYGCAA